MNVKDKIIVYKVQGLEQKLCQVTDPSFIEELRFNGSDVVIFNNFLPEDLNKMFELYPSYEKLKFEIESLKQLNLFVLNEKIKTQEEDVYFLVPELELNDNKSELTKINWSNDDNNLTSIQVLSFNKITLVNGVLHNDKGRLSKSFSKTLSLEEWRNNPNVNVNQLYEVFKVIKVTSIDNNPSDLDQSKWLNNSKYRVVRPTEKEIIDRFNVKKIKEVEDSNLINEVKNYQEQNLSLINSENKTLSEDEEGDSDKLEEEQTLLRGRNLNNDKEELSNDQVQLDEDKSQLSKDLNKLEEESKDSLEEVNLDVSSEPVDSEIEVQENNDEATDEIPSFVSEERDNIPNSEELGNQGSDEDPMFNNNDVKKSSWFTKVLRLLLITIFSSLLAILILYLILTYGSDSIDPWLKRLSNKLWEKGIKLRVPRVKRSWWGSKIVIWWE